MPNSKPTRNELLSGSASGPLQLDVDLQNEEDFSIQVDYDAGGADSLALQVSNDGLTYVTVPTSEQAVDVAGGTHIWEAAGCKSPFLRVLIPAVDVTQVRFYGIRLLDRES